MAAPGGTVLTEVDARDPANMHVVRTMRADGAFVDARQKDAVARVVLSAEPTVRPVGPVKMPAYRLAYGSRKGGHAPRSSAAPACCTRPRTTAPACSPS